MDVLTGRVAARTGARRARIGRWVLLALLLQVALAIVDASVGPRAIFTTTYVLAPFALSLTGRVSVTAASGMLSILLAIASGVWNEFAFSADHLLHVLVVTAGSGLAVLTAGALHRAADERARMALLAAVGHLSGAERVEDAIKGLADALVPAAGDICWVDIDEPDDHRRRLFEHPGDAPPPNAPPDEHTVEIPLQDFPGVLGLATRTDAYTDGDRAFLEILAGRVALVLANARLVTDLRSTRARLDGILGGLAEAVTVHDERGQTVYANEAAARLLGRATPEQVTQAKPGEIAERFAITKEDGTPVRIEDFPGRRLVKGESAPELLTRTIDKVTGQGYWLLTKATLLQDQGRDYAVNIIEDVTAPKDAELRQRFLAEAGQLLASSLDYQTTLQRVADLAVARLADWCAVDMPDPQLGIRQVALAHKDPAKVAKAHELRRRFPPDPEAVGGVPGVLRGGPAEHFHEIPDELLEQAIEDPEQLEAIRELGMRSVMIVPMRVADETLGALTLVTADSGRRFSDADFEFAQDLALRAATAVQNARLYEEQARVAHTLQQSLLPERLPQLEHWAGAASYQAGESGAEVGGDFYDIIATDQGHLVFLGDVTGKGIEAAALTSLVRHSVRTAARFDPRPGEILRLVNELLVEQPKLSPVTLVCALINDDQVTVASAGHPPPLLKRGASVTELGTAGVLLGAVGDRTYEERTSRLERNDIVLLYTDGVTDTPGQTDRFGEQRLHLLLQHAPDDPDEILYSIETMLKHFQYGTAIDDRAMLVLRFVGEEPFTQAA
jgi:PAS domain S-box-containing protein